MAEGATGDCSLRVHSYRATSENERNAHGHFNTVSHDFFRRLDLAETLGKGRLGGSTLRPDAKHML